MSPMWGSNFTFVANLASVDLGGGPSARRSSHLLVTTRHSYEHLTHRLVTFPSQRYRIVPYPHVTYR